ncbi:hypothetical protein VCUG_00516 [Vavraia culicis subsp. floridensis]|uniref:RanBD1 domain-containing protein n=1 Tax=Vavraia culicis (isolate floridensis) TaxID=948595 RepID=L2GXD7_VAVCU|nr:uncharacterized protein VCUG_00516 [Vavraia culicis subsp. floridensis]ELA47933.1 hypothetical protein VCUG_00516 [Vavraia culicis subsp. floridensis]
MIIEETEREKNETERQIDSENGSRVEKEGCVKIKEGDKEGCSESVEEGHGEKSKDHNNGECVKEENGEKSGKMNGEVQGGAKQVNVQIKPESASTSSIFDRPAQPVHKGSEFLKERSDALFIEKEGSDVLNKTGSTADTEEDGKIVIFKASCQLFMFSEKTGAIEQRGEGPIYIKKVEKRNLFKLAMVREKIYKLGCNHFIFPIGKLHRHKTSANTFIWLTKSDKCDDDAKSEERTFVVKFGNGEEAVRFEDRYEYAMDENVKMLKSMKK